MAALNITVPHGQAMASARANFEKGITEAHAQHELADKPNVLFGAPLIGLEPEPHRILGRNRQRHRQHDQIAEGNSQQEQSQPKNQTAVDILLLPHF